VYQGSTGASKRWDLPGTGRVQPGTVMVQPPHIGYEEGRLTIYCGTEWVRPLEGYEEGT